MGTLSKTILGIGLSLELGGFVIVVVGTILAIRNFRVYQRVKQQSPPGANEVLEKGWRFIFMIVGGAILLAVGSGFLLLISRS